MKKKSVIFVKTLFFYLLILNRNVFSQGNIKLSYDNSSWTSVMSGKCVLKPETTSYGFVVLTDARLLTAYSENGKELWNYKVFSRKPNYISVISSDFILLVTDNSNISLINPSGKLLWSKNISFQIIQKPVAGKDSRILIQGKNSIACLGINGIEKWRIKTPELKKLPLQSLDDGTFVTILENPVNGQSAGLRFNPFGDVLETITFASLISDAITTENGILLGFYEGGFGLVSTEGAKNGTGKTVTKWAVPSEDSAFSQTMGSKGMKFVKLSEKLYAAVLCNSSKNVKLIFFESSDGRIRNIFHIPQIEFDKLSCISGTFGKEGLFLSDYKTAVVTDLSGKYLYCATLPSSQGKNTGWNNLFYTSENHIVITGNSWTLTAFRTIQTIKEKQKTAKKAKYSKPQYENFYKIKQTENLISYSDSIPKNIISPERKTELNAGNYGSREIQFTSDIFAVCNEYLSSANVEISRSHYGDKQGLSTDWAGFQALLSQIPLLGTADYPALIARLIRNEKNDSILNTLIITAGKYSYDPENAMLDAINAKLTAIPVKNSTILTSMSNAVYEICLFMGRPALYAYGMEIQKKLLYPQYSSEVRESARNNLSKIARLKM